MTQLATPRNNAPPRTHFLSAHDVASLVQCLGLPHCLAQSMPSCKHSACP
jgi:hypothetical protein